MFYSATEFPWTRAVTDGYQAMRTEYEALGPTDFVRWYEPIYTGDWRVFGLYGFGHRLDLNCARCPLTSSLVEAIPGLTTAGFSLLGAGTEILPHVGLSSRVLRCHVGVVVPDSCGLMVEGETAHWREGEAIVFDDTGLHSAWNRSATPRVVLLLDFLKR